jgi:hypothetical protein
MHFMADTDQDYRSIFFWSGVLIGLLILVFGAYGLLKKWMRSEDDPTPVGFTLSDLRELHRQGKMSTEEFELTKNNMLAAARRTAAQIPPVLPKRTPPEDNAE